VTAQPSGKNKITSTAGGKKKYGNGKFRGLPLYWGNHVSEKPKEKKSGNGGTADGGKTKTGGRGVACFGTGKVGSKNSVQKKMSTKKKHGDPGDQIQGIQLGGGAGFGRITGGPTEQTGGPLPNGWEERLGRSAGEGSGKGKWNYKEWCGRGETTATYPVGKKGKVRPLMQEYCDSIVKGRGPQKKKKSVAKVHGGGKKKHGGIMEERVSAGGIQKRLP